MLNSGLVAGVFWMCMATLLSSVAGDGWAILFSHPKDFTPICTTELGYMAGLQPEFEKRNCKVIGISVDGVSDHEKWSQDIQKSDRSALP